MKQVRCVETGVVYNSIAAAARAHGVTPAMIAHVLKGRQATAAGYTWEYTGLTPPRQTRYKGVYRDRNGKIYRSLKSFADEHGYTIRQVQAATVNDMNACRLIDLEI